MAALVVEAASWMATSGSLKQMAALPALDAEASVLNFDGARAPLDGSARCVPACSGLVVVVPTETTRALKALLVMAQPAVLAAAVEHCKQN